MFVPVIISLAKGIPVTPKQQAAPLLQAARQAASKQKAEKKRRDNARKRAT